MNNMKGALFLFALALAGCDQSGSEPAPPPETDSASVATETKPDTYATQPAGGQLNGRAFTVERARLNDRILQLRSGKDFFADRELKVFFFDESSMENRELIAEAARMRPHVHISWRDEGDSLPKTEVLMDGYELAMKFGAFTEFGVPYAIRFRTDKLPNTEVSGTGFATFEDLNVVDGKLDRAFDGFGTLRYIGREYLEGEHGVDIEVLGEFAGRYIGGDRLPKTGYLGLEYRPEGGEEQVAKLQMLKDANGWRVANRLPVDQINEAHPLVADPSSPPSARSGAMLEVAAALFVEEQLRRDGSISKVRYTSASCNMDSSYTKGSCRITYALKEGSAQECFARTLLLSFKGDRWQVERELNDNQRIAYRTGELEEFDAEAPSCGF